MRWGGWLRSTVRSGRRRGRRSADAGAVRTHPCRVRFFGMPLRAFTFTMFVLPEIGVNARNAVKLQYQPIEQVFPRRTPCATRDQYRLCQVRPACAASTGACSVRGNFGGDILVFWSIAMILGYFFIGIAKVVEEVNASPADRPGHGKNRDLFQAAHMLVLWPRYVPMPWAALTAHVLVVAARLVGLGLLRRRSVCSRGHRGGNAHRRIELVPDPHWKAYAMNGGAAA